MWIFDVLISIKYNFGVNMEEDFNVSNNQTNSNNLNSNEKKILLKEFNHELNNNLQFLLAFIKLQKRFGIDNNEIINSTCVSIASISLIQNKKCNLDNEDGLILIKDFFKDYLGILNEYYSKFNIDFSIEIEDDFYLKTKKLFHLISLINELINLSIDYTFNNSIDNKIIINIKRNLDDGLLVYSDSGLGIKKFLSSSNLRKSLIEQLIKQIDGSLEFSDDDSLFTIKFKY